MRVSLYKKILIHCILLSGCFAMLNAQGDKREFYQLKIYTLATEAQEKITEAYLKEAYLPALKRQDISNIGVFKLRPETRDTLRQIFVLLPFSSLDKIYGLDRALLTDKAYKTKGKAYLNAPYGQPPYQRIESIVLRAFEHMPRLKPSVIKGLRENRIYELRSYESPTEMIYRNKVDMFNAGGEVALFDELDFNAVFYADVISGPNMPNLMYMTTFKDQESRDAHWDTFREAPKWKEISSMLKYQNNVSHIDKIFLYPTEYSDY